MTSLTSKKHYIGNVSSNKFYYKDAIFAYYNMGFLTAIFPIEIINKILSYICSSLVVFATNKTIHYVNPKDNAIIKSIRLNVIDELNSEQDTFAISEDGMTFYKMCLDEFSPNHLIHFEYLCNEVPDPKKPRNGTYGNRYFHTYNINKLGPSSNEFYISTDGKYIVLINNNTTNSINIYETKTKTLVKEINCDAEIINVSVSPDNNYIMAITSSNNKQTVWIWNIKTGDIVYQHLCADDMIFDKFYNKISWNHNNNLTVKFTITFGVKNTSEERTIIGSRILYGTLNDTYFIDTPGKDIFGVIFINDEDVACYNNCKIFLNKWNHVLEEPFLDTKQTGHYVHKLVALDNHLIVISDDQSDSLVNRMLSRLNMNDDETDGFEIPEGTWGQFPTDDGAWEHQQSPTDDEDNGWRQQPPTDDNDDVDEDNGWRQQPPTDDGWGQPLNADNDNGWGQPLNADDDNGWGQPQSTDDNDEDNYWEQHYEDNYDNVENAFNIDMILIPINTSLVA